MRYFVIEVTNGEEHWYHTGGRGNGAFANLYEESQVNRILGQYKNPRYKMSARPVEVSFIDKGEE